MKTSSVPTPSHPHAEKFVCPIFNTSEDSLDLAGVVLFGLEVSSPERLPSISDAFRHRQHLKRCHYTKPQDGARHTFINWCFRRSTGLCLYEIGSNTLSMSRNDFHADAPLAARLFAVNAESRIGRVHWAVWMHIRRTLIAASTCAKALKDACMKINISSVFLRVFRRFINDI